MNSRLEIGISEVCAMLGMSLPGLLSRKIRVHRVRERPHTRGIR